VLRKVIPERLTDHDGLAFTAQPGLALDLPAQSLGQSHKQAVRLGCFLRHGKTVRPLSYIVNRKAKKCIDIDCALTDNRRQMTTEQLPDVQFKSFAVRLPRALRIKVEKEAARRLISASDVIREALLNKFGRVR